MKKIITLIACICALAIQAQIVNYQKVKITGDENLPKKLLQLGITIDHSDAGDTEVITEISDEEVAILKKNNINYVVEIPNLSKFYEERNKADVQSKSLPSGVCNAPTIQKPSNFHLGSMGGYFTFVEMQQILDSMALLYPNLITVKQAIDPIQSIEGRTIWYVKISDNPNINEAEPQVLYTALHHAREACSLSQLIFYMWYILENYSTNPDIAATINSTELYFVPCLNPDGYVFNQTNSPNGGGMWRKNRRVNGGNTFGVDLNRNYGDHWGFDNIGSSPTSSSDTYRGTAAFSEPETQAIRNFCNSHSFVSALNAHTYGNLLVYPWGYIPSLLTPDSMTFINLGVHLTEESRLQYGTCDQTLAYIVNGDSDDWMYGEQSTKPKIYAMTPEAGSAADGFWPASSRILDICKTTFKQNYYLAKAAANYGTVRDMQDQFISSNNGFIKYDLRRLGLQAGTISVSITPLGAGLATVGAPKVYSSLSLNQLILDSIAYTTSPSLSQGQAISYVITTNFGSNGFKTDTIQKIYGTPQIVLNDNGTSVTTNYTTTLWGTTTTSFKSPPSSITESPTGNYPNNANRNITSKVGLNLSGATYAHLQYYTRFQLEKNNDKVQLAISTNGGTSWTPVCGKYKTSPASFGGTIPVYDGLQDEWVKENIDLSAYVNQTVLLRFTMTSNASTTKDGFYFDDMLIRKINNPSVGISETSISLGDVLTVYPNPANDYIQINKTNSEIGQLELMDVTGKIIKQEVLSEMNQRIFTNELSAGIYLLRLTMNGEVFTHRIQVIH
jgi:carboxypeptidase T